jgi:hypothetical protein
MTVPVLGKGTVMNFRANSQHRFVLDVRRKAIETKDTPKDETREKEEKKLDMEYFICRLISGQKSHELLSMYDDPGEHNQKTNMYEGKTLSRGCL